MKNIVLGSFFLLFAAVVFLISFQFPNSDASYKDPAVYPNALAILIVVISSVLLIQGIISVKKDKSSERISQGAVKLPLVLIGMTIAYILLMQVIGFIFSTFIYLLLVFLSFGGYKKPGIVFSLVLTGAEYALFHVVLRVRLPEPILEKILQAI